MSISIADRLVFSPDDVSELARLAIAFIDGGTEWFRWAIDEPRARYAFSDETAMADAIQQGLHGSKLALLPGLQLMVSPVKLMALGLTDLRVLARAESGDTGARLENQTRQVLHRHGLLTEADLDQGESVLTELGVAGAPVFQLQGIDDRLAIYQLVVPETDAVPSSDAAPSPDLEKEAAAFAVKQARNPAEFVDYYKFYLSLAAKLADKADTPDKREARAEAALLTLLPLLFGALDCPQVGGLASPDQVAQAVESWLLSGHSVGFTRLSAGAREIVLRTAYKGQTGQRARDIVDRYLAGAQAMLASTSPDRGLMAQDGATCIFPIQDGDEEAALRLGPTGAITLASFRRAPIPMAKAASAAGRSEAQMESAP